MIDAPDERSTQTNGVVPSPGIVGAGGALAPLTPTVIACTPDWFNKGTTERVRPGTSLWLIAIV